MKGLDMSDQQWEVIRDKMLSALIRYDKMAEKRSQWWNKYAMAHYCRALQDMDENISDGYTIQEALNKSFIHSPPTCQPYKSLKRVLDSF